MKTNHLHSLVVLVFFLLGGCTATPLKQEHMVAEITPITGHATGKTIRVFPVNVTDVPKLDWADAQWQPLDRESFTDAIVETLGLSGLFTGVSKSDPSDYRLSAEIVGQRHVGSANSIFLLLVRYQLHESDSGSILWTENLLSFHYMSVVDVFMGTDRLAQVLEATVRKNLIQLVERLDEILPP